MKLYFTPFACSLAARIAVEEAGLDAEFVQVLPGRKLPDGGDFTRVSPMGYVPALETRSGITLTEGPAVLQYLADNAEDGVLAPALFSEERYRMQLWLNFVSTEVHKAVFAVLFAKDAGAVEKDAALGRVARPFEVLSAHLEGREHLGAGFTVADAYLLSVLNWCETAGVDIAAWPVLLGYRTRLRTRPSVMRAMAAEMPLLKAA
ncbi:MAG TPA: glutathione binding-like protein [Sphingomonas sp.]|nr:glutathione binding-like protein [Sphingomonas sp.]